MRWSFPWPGDDGQGKVPLPSAEALLVMTPLPTVAVYKEPAQRAEFFCPIVVPDRAKIKFTLCSLCGNKRRDLSDRPLYARTNRPTIVSMFNDKCAMPDAK